MAVKALCFDNCTISNNMADKAKALSVVLFLLMRQSKA